MRKPIDVKAQVEVTLYDISYDGEKLPIPLILRRVLHQS